VSFVLGLLVIPVWVLTIVADEGAIRRRVGSLVAPAIRTDVFAITRIVDRAFGTFLRIRVLLAIVVSVFIFIGVEIAASLGIGTGAYAAGIAALLGILQLIPELGFFLGFFPLLLILAAAGPEPFLAALVVYVVSVKLASGLVETRVSRGVLDVHPGLLIPGIVVLSQFGPLWLLFAAPFIAILRDVVRYLAGRLAEPPQPAGLLPGDRRSRAAAARAAATPVPTVYRTTRATPRAGAAAGQSRSPIQRLEIPSFTAAVTFGAASAGMSAQRVASADASARSAPGAPEPAPERSPIQ
jgi:hypothetical protein